MSSKIRLVLAEEKPLYRAGIRYFLEKDEAILVTGEASSGTEALHLATETMPDVLVFDMQLPQLSGFEIVHSLRSQESSIRILALSQYDDEMYLTKIVASGVNGCVLKTEDPTVLVEAIHAIASKNEQWLSKGITSKLFTKKNMQAFAASLYSLSNRETQILHLMAQGYDNQRIAETLCLSLGTVKNYISSIYLKLQVDTRAEAIIWVWQRGLFHAQPSILTAS